MTEKMKDDIKKMKLEQFIGIFPNAINEHLCSELVNFFNIVSEQGLTLSSTMDFDHALPNSRNDEVIHLPSGLTGPCFPQKLLTPFWNSITECFIQYRNGYGLEQAMTSFNFKMHRVHPSGGYHQWHHEHGYE